MNKNRPIFVWAVVRRLAVWLLVWGSVTVFAYKTQQYPFGSQTLVGWLPILGAAGLATVSALAKVVARRSSPGFGKELRALVRDALLTVTAAGTAAAFFLAGPSIPSLEKFASGAGGTAVLASAAASLVAWGAWGRLRRSRRWKSTPEAP